MTDDTHTPSDSQSHPSSQEELAPFHTSETMTESPLLKRDPLLASPSNENPNKEQLLDNELTAACVALDQDLCAHLSRDEVERSEAQPNDDHSQTDYTTSSPFPRRHHSHLYPPAPPNNTPETNSPGFGDVSFEVVYQQVPERQLSIAQTFAAKGGEEGRQEGTETGETVRDAHAVAQEEPMESNPACEGNIPDVDSQGILQKMMFEKFGVRLDDQSEANCTEQIDCTPGQEVSPENVDEATSNSGEMQNSEETEEDSPSMDRQSRPNPDRVVPYTVAENPHSTHNEESAEDMATPVDETSNGTEVREKQDDLEFDVESLAITDPAVLSQTGIVSDNVPECLPSREVETDALASNSMARIGTNLHQDKLAIFESNIAITNEPQSDEGDIAENKSLKRPYEESPMTYPKSVLERKPEVEIKKNLFGETSNAISGEKCASESQLGEDLLNTRMLGQGINPTEPRKLLKTEHYNEQLGEDMATLVDDTSNGTHVHAKQDDLECNVESLAITDPAVLCQTSVVSDNVPECLPSPEVETDALASNSMACIGTNLHQDSEFAICDSKIHEPQSDEGDNAENKSLKRSYGESPMSYPKSVLERKPEVEIKKNLFGETSTVINGENSANESQSQEDLLNIRMTGRDIDPTEPRKSLKTEHYDAHGREAYIEVSKFDSVTPEEDAEGNPNCLNTDESIQVSVPPLKLEANDEPSGITEIVSLEPAEVLPQLKASTPASVTYSATSTTTPTLDAGACYVNTADGSSPAQNEEKAIATTPMIESRPVAEDKSDTSAAVYKLLTDPKTPKGTEIHLDRQPDQKSVNLDHVLQDEDTNNAAKSEELPFKDLPSNLNDITSSGAVCDLEIVTTPDGLPSKELLLDSNDIPLSNTVRQRIKRNEVSDTLPLAEAAKSSVDGLEPGSFTLRIMTCGMIGVTVFILLELLFPSQLEYIIAGLMGRTEGWMES